MDAFMKEMSEKATSFRNMALPIVSCYKEFWVYSKELASRTRWYKKYFERRNLKQKTALAVIDYVLASDVLTDESFIHFANYLQPTREVVVYSTIKILKQHDNRDLQRLFEMYKDEVVAKILEKWNDYLWKIATSDKITKTLSPEVKYTYAVMGLIKAIHKFDFNSGKSIPTFAYNWIFDQIRNGAIDENSLVHIPDSKRTEAITYMKKRNFDKPDDEKFKAYQAMILNANKAYATSLDAKVKDSDDITYGDIIHRNESDVELNRMELMMILEKNLTPDELQLIRSMFYGGEARATKQEVAEELGVSEKTVTKLFERIKAKLQKVPELKEMLLEMVNGGTYETVRLV